MSLLSDRERTLATAISRLAGANPFLPERVEAEREALGPDFVESGKVWHARVRPEAYPNLAALDQRASLLAGALRRKLAAGTPAQGDEALLYEDLVLYVLSTRYLPALQSLVDEPRKATAPVAAYTPFAQDVAHYLDLPGLTPILKKVCDQFDIIFDQLCSAVAAGPAETLHMGAWVNKRTLGIMRAVVGIHLIFTSNNF